MENKWYFSILSGEIYQVPLENVYALDSHQIPLKEKPNSNCRKCYGRFYESYYIKGDYYEICKKCGRKLIDFDFIKHVREHNTKKDNQ